MNKCGAGASIQVKNACYMVRGAGVCTSPLVQRQFDHLNCAQICLG